MEGKICTKDCKWCQPYNDGWAVCWHSKLKSSKVQLNTECKVQMVKRTIEKLKAKEREQE